VQVYEDCQHDTYAGRFGTVVSVHEEPEPIYPMGRVEVQLVIDDFYRKLFHPDRPPKTVWFKPNDLERL
jgi:hypothetical protein